MDEIKERKKIPHWFWYLAAIVLLFAVPGFYVFVLIYVVLWCVYQFFKAIYQDEVDLKAIHEDEVDLRKKDLPVQRTLAEIDAMDGFEFERCMKQIYENLGYSAHHTPLSGDQGADLILTSNEGIRTAVQCKCYSNKVSNKAVQEVVAAKGFHKCSKGMVVTNNFFTDSAIQLAKANDINLVDRAGLTNVLKESYQLMYEKHKNARK